MINIAQTGKDFFTKFLVEKYPALSQKYLFKELPFPRDCNRTSHKMLYCFTIIEYLAFESEEQSLA